MMLYHLCLLRKTKSPIDEQLVFPGLTIKIKDRCFTYHFKSLQVPKEYIFFIHFARCICNKFQIRMKLFQISVLFV